MSFQSFGRSTPEDDVTTAYTRLRGFFEKERLEGAYNKVFSTHRIYDLTDNIGMSALAQALASLVAEGFVQAIVRVEPRYGEGIGDFTSFEDVPEEIEDWRRPGNLVKVLPEHLQVYYRIAR